MEKYPDWFEYEVGQFGADSVADINEKLVALDVDARDVINVMYGIENSVHMFSVLFKQQL